MNAIVVLDKPLGMSSLAAAQKVARALGERRVGHGGTLDPRASGVLPVCLGEATKLAAFLLHGDKEYEAEIVFGVETDTLDGEGRVTARQDASHLEAATVRAALAGLQGPQAQTPPMYSALRSKGRRLYKLARAGLEVERAPRPIEIFALELLAFSNAIARVRIACSKGTYVRVLAADLGRALGTGAHLSALRRTRSGPFTLAQAVALANVARAQPLALAAALPDWPEARLSSGLLDRVRHGRALSAAELGCPEAPPGTRLRLLTVRGDLAALAEVRAGGQVRVLRGFNYGLTDEPLSAILPTN
ncbi:MAG TPA: tRNA pseudouridine(55) synthase TruB [Polyangia bacterium]|nr:tRNA pseudouridine(55) synthase TruB [Polyangia bacterium]